MGFEPLVIWYEIMDTTDEWMMSLSRKYYLNLNNSIFKNYIYTQINNFSPTDQEVKNMYGQTLK